MRDLELQSPVTILTNFDLLHGINDVVCAEVVYLLSLVRCTHSDDDAASRDRCLDAGGRVLEDGRLLGIETEICRGQEEGVGERLAALQTGVVGGYADFGNLNSALIRGSSDQGSMVLTLRAPDNRGNMSSHLTWRLHTCHPGES